LKKIRPIAIHLPQFHPFPENDEWWGKGFTEWTNVAKAKPLFKGHYQPHLPADLGFYDLRLEEARMAQIALAKEYGIYGFCYYHYWFNGKRLMHQPLDKMLANPKEDFPFMFCWANETWSRRWLGEEKEILIKQTYSKEDDIKHAEWLCNNVFIDKRYITIDDRPIFVFYRPRDLPNYLETIQTFKSVAKRKGINEPYLVASNSRGENQSFEGFDHVLSFEPKLGVLDQAFNDKKYSIRKFINNFKNNIISPELKVYDYGRFKDQMALKSYSYEYFPCVFVGWDNTARREKRGIILNNQTPERFKQSLIEAKEKVKHFKSDEQIIFINAWNEWAEGNHLEPDQKDGHKYLEIVREIFK